MEQTGTKVTLNIGPQHPSTHGILRLCVDLDCEKILEVRPVLGYLHRGIEKMAQERTYSRFSSVVNRIDYLSPLFYSHSYLGALEKLTNVEIPKRAMYLRVLFMELNRISSHLVWLGAFLMDLGASSPFFYAFNKREGIMEIFEQLSGQRLLPDYFTYGGVNKDIDNELSDKISLYISELESSINEWGTLISENPIFTSRTLGIGVISKEEAKQYSLFGPNLRASGEIIDFRREKPYLAYKELVFDTPTSTFGDCHARYSVRIGEMRQSAKIISQCLEWLKTDKNGEIKAPVDFNNLEPQSGEAINFVEGPRGLIYTYIKSEGGPKPSRVKFRAPSFYAIQILDEICKGSSLQDLYAVFGSLDILVSEADR